MSYWKGRPVLVTGSTGFLGRALTGQLAGLGAKIVTLTRDYLEEVDYAYTNVRGDVRDERLIGRVLSEYDIETVFHLAAQALVGVANDNPVETFDVNVNGTLAVLEAVRKVRPDTRLVIASSDKAYGDSPVLPYTEATPLNGRNPYDCSKSCADLIAQSYLATYGTNLAITRCGNLYGPGDLNWSRLIPGTIRRVERGETPVIRGSGRETRDYLYVEDAVSAYLALAQARYVGAFNFSTGVQYSVRDVVETICLLMGAPVTYEVRDDADREIVFQGLDCQKAKSMLSWQPAYTLAQGLIESIHWYRPRLRAESVSRLAA